MSSKLKRMRLNTTATALALMALALPATAADSEFRIVHQKQLRSYVVHIPEVASTHMSARPLVMVLHGGGGNADNAARMSGMNAIADREGFLVVYPNGSGPLRTTLLTWNAGNCCGAALENQVDDVGFLNAVLDQVAQRYPVDPRRVYLTGLSNGGMMTYRMGCEAPWRFAAIAPVAGAMNVQCAPTVPLSVIAFHGTADEHVLYNGGAPIKNLDVRHPRVDTAESIAMQFWSTFNACQSNTRTSAAEVRTETWDNCSQGTTVQLNTLEGFGHAWPGGQKGSRFGDDPTASIKASETMWQFFSRHTR